MGIETTIFVVGVVSSVALAAFLSIGGRRITRRPHPQPRSKSRLAADGAAP